MRIELYQQFISNTFKIIFLPPRSTKLVIIERLLLLAERYVITIEVSLSFSGNFICSITRLNVLCMDI